MIFGELLTGSNFDDNTKKITGGRNGFGAKLTNIFSTHFSVECADASRKKIIFIQWKKNMTEMEEIKYKRFDNGTKDYVHVIFRPDFSKFG